MKKICLVLVSVILCFTLSGCCENDSDIVEIQGKSSIIFDNQRIILPDGFFSSGYEKMKIDDNNLDLVIHFTRELSELDEWK